MLVTDLSRLPSRIAQLAALKTSILAVTAVSILRRPVNSSSSWSLRNCLSGQCFFTTCICPPFRGVVCMNIEEVGVRIASLAGMEQDGHITGK